jgi:hypothetical protein
VRCAECARTHVLLPTALQPRCADTTELIGTALTHKAHGLGFRRIATVMGRAESTVRRWLRRASETHVNWAYQHGAARLIALNPDAFTALRFTGNLVRDTLAVLAAAAYWDARVCGFADPPWALIGMYTRGRLLAPPASR